jgi:hypothetical protein
LDCLYRDNNNNNNSIADKEQNLAGVIIFYSVFIKNNNKIKFFLKKKLKLGQTDRFWFGFLGQKPVQTNLAQFFRFGSVFPV